MQHFYPEHNYTYGSWRSMLTPSRELRSLEKASIVRAEASLQVKEIREECLEVPQVPSLKLGRMSTIENLKGFDPFADAAKGDDDSVQDGLVHIRIQQRNGRKTLTTVQGLAKEYDLKKIVRACKKEFACNGTVVEHPEYGEVLQLQGDQRHNICDWLTKVGLVKADQLKVHGF